MVADTGLSGRWKRALVALVVAGTLSIPVAGWGDPKPAAPDALADGFRDPPNGARPRVWWHWMNGNITKDGIAKDLAWMKRIGIGGAQTFDANLNTPQVVDKRLVYMTPEWKDAFRFAASEAERQGLELAIASSPGWSETGGPWVPPHDAMKKLVWSETALVGGRRYTGPLAPPPMVTGPYQAIAMGPDITDMMSRGKPSVPKTYYADVAVLAYTAREAAMPPPRVLGPGGEVVDGSAIFDDDPQTSLSIRGSIALDYGTPQRVRSASLFLPGAKPPIGDVSIAVRLEASDDGKAWRPVTALEVTDVPTTVSFAPVTARLFRIMITGTDPKVPDGVAHSAKIGWVRLSSDARIDHFETKAGFATAPDYYALPSVTDGEQGVAPGAVIDITSHMRPDGTLDWTPPKGDWRVLRLGTSLLGTRNHPATPEATGLEVDKFDGAAVRRYLDTYLGMYRETAGADLIGQHGVRAIVTDSIEVGAANWTPRMIEHFKALRGYDPTPWLRALSGTLIGTRAQSDAFLFDYRRTLADLIASEHYGTVAAVAHQNGLKLYGEALEDHRPMLGDDMAMRSHTDVPMAAMWTYAPEAGPKPTYLADVKGAASVAHLYGQNLVAAESMTSARKPWAFGPADLRPVIDLEFATGVNRPVIHTSVHQPLDDKVPGLSLFYFGQFFNRHESWAEMAGPWVEYMARTSFLLQQGRNVADVVYFYGEEAPLTGLYGDTPVADAPTRYAYDFANTGVLGTLLSVDHGDLVARSGARYRLLYLGGSSRRMTLPTLRRIADLVKQGATLVGDAPAGSPGLGDDTPEYRALVATLWNGPVTRVGAGRVIAGQDVEAALAAIGAAADFSYVPPLPDSRILFVHRRIDDGDLYYLDNRQNRAEHVEARFRVTGKAPQIWRADTGKAEPVSYRIESGETVVPLDFNPQESFFVVFRQPAATPSLSVAKPGLAAVSTIDGPWDVSFQPDRGAPAAIALASLGSLSAQPDPGVKYFSGVATYSKTFQLPRGQRAGAPLMLDLGEVGVIAEVRVNGRLVGTAWHAPYRMDIGQATRPGRNRLEVRVADLWVNRLIGDAQPGASKVTFTTIPTYPAATPLRPSGLIGPVRLLRQVP